MGGKEESCSPWSEVSPPKFFRLYLDFGPPCFARQSDASRRVAGGGLRQAGARHAHESPSATSCVFTLHKSCLSPLYLFRLADYEHFGATAGVTKRSFEHTPLSPLRVMFMC